MNLHHTNLVVLLRLVDMTYGWTRYEYFTTDREILGGRVNAEGEAFLAPLNMSLSSLKRARQALAERGYIFFEHDPLRNRTMYQVNFDMVLDDQLWKQKQRDLTFGPDY